jgi:hypothetical protein
LNTSPAVRAAKINDNSDIVAIGQNSSKVLAIKIIDTGMAIKLTAAGLTPVIPKASE